MPIVVVCPEGRDYTRSVEEYVRDYERRVGQKLQIIDPESRDGADFCRSYDIAEYPSVVALSADGSVLKMWKGTDLQLMNEVSYYDQDN